MEITKLTKTCHATPSQWEGRVSTGQDIYVRYRNGQFGHGLGWSEDEAVENCETYPLDNPEFDGWMTTATMLEHLSDEGIQLRYNVTVDDPHGDMSLDDWRRNILEWPEEDVVKFSGRGVFKV